jgi:DNA-binding MarR family transcriptional regulator
MRLEGKPVDYNYQEAMKLSNQLCFPLYAAARSVISLYTPYLKPLGLTYTQYIVLLVLWEKKTATVGELCDTLMLDNGTLTPLLRKLQTAGYIDRRRSEKDDRVVVISLTEAGKDFQIQARDIPLKVGSCLDLPQEKAQTLYELLYELLNSQNKQEEQGKCIPG